MRKLKLPFHWLAIVLLLMLFPLTGASEYIIRVACTCMIFVMLSTSLNLISGVAGQISMGHAGFYAIGAYTSALLVMRLGFPVWAGLICAGIMSAIVGFLIGIPALKLAGGYLAILTLGFAEIIRLIAINWDSLTMGQYGLSNIPVPEFFGVVLNTNSKYYFYELLVTLATIFILNNLIKSRFGRNLRAIKDDEYAAEASGVNVHMTKVAAFTVAAFFAGLAGSLYAHLITYLDPSAFVADVSTTVLAMVVLGGVGNQGLTIVAAILLTIIPEFLRGFVKYRLLIYGFVLIFAMLIKTVNFKQIKFFRPYFNLKEKLAWNREDLNG